MNLIHVIDEVFDIRVFDVGFNGFDKKNVSVCGAGPSLYISLYFDTRVGCCGLILVAVHLFY